MPITLTKNSEEEYDDSFVRDCKSVKKMIELLGLALSRVNACSLPDNKI